MTLSRRQALTIWLAVFVIFGAACQEGYRVVEENAREKGANIRLNNFTRTSVKVDGTPEWQVDAREAYIYQKEGKESNIITYDFEFKQFDDRGKVTSTLTAERGEINYEEQQLRLTGGVLYKSAEQTIETEKMRFDIETEIVSSDDPVKIIEGASVTRCRRGVVVDRPNERQVCKSPVGLSVSVPGAGDGSGEIDIFQ